MQCTRCLTGGAVTSHLVKHTGPRAAQSRVTPEACVQRTRRLTWGRDLARVKHTGPRAAQHYVSRNMVVSRPMRDFDNTSLFPGVSVSIW